MKNSNYLAEIETTYRTIDNSFDNTYKKCKTEEEKEMLTASRDAARDAFWTSVDANLANNSIFINKLHKDLHTANTQLKDELLHLSGIKTVIKAIESAVRLAAALAKFLA